MDRSRTRFQLEPGLWLDARRAVWFEASRTLAVADLHLGYAWAHRFNGQLLPISVREDTIDRLAALLECYAPEELVILGDIVHAAVPIDPLREELERLGTLLKSSTRGVLVAGNHDVHLAGLLREWRFPMELAREHNVGAHRLLHGDIADERKAGAELAVIQAAKGRVIYGHEHPALTLSDGVASSFRCPCFLIGTGALVLPAFSPWAAGSNVRNKQFLSAYSRNAQFRQAIAILAEKLLPVPL